MLPEAVFLFLTCGKICSSSHFLYNRHARVALKYDSGVSYTDMLVVQKM